jgi:hypothetical protein
MQQPGFGGDQHWGRPEELGYGAPPPGPPGKPGKSGKKGRGWIIALVAALLVGVVAGGGVYAATLLSGGGTQPHEVLPGEAAVYFRLDLDPAANQKVALFTIARKFNATKDAFSGDDPRKAFFEMLRKDSPDLSKIDYAADIEPWLGDRVGVALLPPPGGGDEPDVAVAVQVTDEDAARAGIKKLGSTSGGDKTGVAFRDGYAILAEDQAKADTYAKAAPLSDNATFTGDLDALGEPGVLSLWMDMAKVVKSGVLGTGANTASLEQVKNARIAAALRFDSNYVELTGIGRGIDNGGVSDPEPVKISQLPASTVGALSISGLGEAFEKQWPKVQTAISAVPDGQAFTQFLTQAQQSYGITVPDDLITLFGKNLTVAVDEQGLDGGQPNAGVIMTTDPTKAQDVLTKLERALAASGAPFQLAKTPGDGKLVVATNQAYAGKLAAEGTLGESETFKLAIANPDEATGVFYLDLDKIEKLYLANMQGEEKEILQVLRGIGMSGTSSGDEGSFSLRVLLN